MKKENADVAPSMAGYNYSPYVYDPKYVYFFDAGPGYVNGWTKQGAEGKCVIYGGQLANINQLKYAGALGFQRCSTGWLKDGAGLYMQKASSACGTAGYNPWPSNDINRKYSTICYGPKPDVNVPMTQIA